jgi:hypothetical protein
MIHARIPAGLLIAAVTACGATPALVDGPGASRFAVQRATEGRLRVIAFDSHDATHAMLRVQIGMPTMSLPLPGGDWLVAFDGQIAARLSPDGAVHWSRELAIDRAIVAGPDLIVARSIVGSRPDQVLSIVGLHGDGSVAWRMNAGSLPVTNASGLIRTPGATIVTFQGGELAVDDSGVGLWKIEAPGDRYASDVAAYVAGAGLVVVRAAPAAAEPAVSPRPRMPMIAQLIDPRTGKELARAELEPDADAWALADVAVVGNRLVVRAADSYAIPGAGSVLKFVVFSVGRGSIAVADAFVQPTSIEELGRLAPIGRDEAIFLEHSRASLEIMLVDVATHRVRRMPVLRADVQVYDHRRAGDSFTLLGDLSGTATIGARHVHADVRQVMGMDGTTGFAPLWFLGAFTAR